MHFRINPYVVFNGRRYIRCFSSRSLEMLHKFHFFLAIDRTFFMEMEGDRFSVKVKLKLLLKGNYLDNCLPQAYFTEAAGLCDNTLVTSLLNRTDVTIVSASFNPICPTDNR